MSHARHAAALLAAIHAAERSRRAGIDPNVILNSLSEVARQVEEQRAKEAAMPTNERDWPDRNTL